MEEIKCDSCGTVLTNPITYTTITGMHISIFIDKGLNSTEIEYNRVMEMFGKSDFDICYCCLIKAMGIKPKEKVPMTLITSSQIKSVGFKDNTLYIEFNKGTVYTYSDVPKLCFKLMLKVENPGKYFSEYIKGKYDFIKTDKIVTNNEIK